MLQIRLVGALVPEKEISFPTKVPDHEEQVGENPGVHSPAAALYLLSRGLPGWGGQAGEERGQEQGEEGAVCSARPHL